MYASISLPCPRSRAFSGRSRLLTSTSAPPSSSRRRCSSLERVAPADLAGIVGVEDAAVLRPDLDPDDGAAQHAPEDDIVDRAQRSRDHREEAVGERRLDELPGLEHLRPRVAASPRRSRPTAARSTRRRRSRRSPRPCRAHSAGAPTASSAEPRAGVVGETGRHRSASSPLPARVRARVRTNVPLPARPAGGDCSPRQRPTRRTDVQTHHSRPRRSPSPPSTAVVAAPGAVAKDGDVRVKGTCTTAATSKLKLGAEDGGSRSSSRSTRTATACRGRSRCGATGRSSPRRPRRRAHRAARSPSAASSPTHPGWRTASSPSRRARAARRARRPASL